MNGKCQCGKPARAPLPIEIPADCSHSNGHNDQWEYHFPNGFGASVVQGPYTYGGDSGLFELAVLARDGDDWSLTYETPVTNDVLGWLDLPKVAETLVQIAALPVVAS
jgi:hypothetical protein